MTRTKRMRLNLNRASHARKYARMRNKGWRVLSQTQWGLYVIVMFAKG